MFARPILPVRRLTGSMLKRCKIVERQGGKFLCVGDVKYFAVGEVESHWDIVGLVEYPSLAAFVKIATSSEVAEIGMHRAAGLEGQLLICVSQR
jgi:uncharacterized protein (DUF1330 family)